MAAWRTGRAAADAAAHAWPDGQLLKAHNACCLQAVAADGHGALEQAKELYFKLLECLTRCHALEKVPDCQAAIMARFRVSAVAAVAAQKCPSVHLSGIAVCE